ncbi:MAG: hypothetical protein H6826_14390 [Planctomycetes bacterium]|nr:hypothetical protein [Planctomycetota bacterium]
MAKTSKKQQIENAVIAKAAGRAVGAIDADAYDLEPGTYTVDVTLRIQGDITVGEPTTAKTQTIGALECLAAYAINSGEELESWAVEGAALLKQQRRSKAGREALDEAVKRLSPAIKSCAEKHGFVEEKPRKGSVTGKPEATVVKGGLAA